MTAYTHDMHYSYCADQMALGLPAASRRVQVLKQGVLYCASLVAPWNALGMPDCWIVDADFPERVRLKVVCKNVRACVRCACSGHERGRAGGTRREALRGQREGVTCK